MLLSSSLTSKMLTGLAALAVVAAAAGALADLAGAGAGVASSCLPQAARARVTLAASSSGFKCLYVMDIPLHGFNKSPAGVGCRAGRSCGLSPLPGHDPPR